MDNEVKGLSKYDTQDKQTNIGTTNIILYSNNEETHNI